MSGTAAAVAEATDPPVPADPPDIEVRARGMGWKPQTEYRGPAEAWRDAEEFVRRGETELPVVRERYRAAERKIAELEGKVSQSTAVISDLTERFRTSDERAYKRARAELVRERDTAIETGDKAAVHRVDADIRELEQTAPRPPAAAPPPAPPAAAHPDAIAWHGRNPWFQADPVLTEAAKTIHMGLMATEPSLTVAENLDRVTEAVRALHPGRMPAAPRAARPAADPPDDNPRRSEVAAVASSSAPRGPGRPNPRSFEALPKESKDAFHRYAKQIEAKPGAKPLTKEEWAGYAYEKDE